MLELLAPSDRVPERRMAPRRRGPAPVRLVPSPTSDPIETVALDLGPRGVLLCGSPRLRVGQSVVLSIALAGRDEIVCQGDVVRIDAAGCRALTLQHLRPAEIDALTRYARSA